MNNTPSMQELLEAGVHFGHQVRRGNPRMKQYVYGARDGVHIIDLTQSEKLLKEACEFVYTQASEGKVVLFVGTKKQARDIIRDSAKRVGAPYMVERWVGGFLTNFEEIGKRIKKMEDLKVQREKGELSKYTKKEQLLIDREITKLEQTYAGVTSMKVLPDAVFVIDTVAEATAVKECARVGVKVVAIADTNCDPRLIDYPVPGNDDAIKSITILTNAIASAYEAGIKEAGVVAVKKAAEAEKAAKKAAEEAEKKLAEEVAPELKDEVAAAEEEIEKVTIQESERKV
ncbi:MAG: 30S ribosomal protein S2 [Candidatus Daviesbacteria bacterium]|nr:30S ribosomal protein S2 [Candidatus Daviesbacteria bacterium]